MYHKPAHKDVEHPAGQADASNGPKPEGPKVFPLFDTILAYELGELDHDKCVELFQHLIDNGMAWTLQGAYGRTADRLIESGDCHHPRYRVRRALTK